MGTKWVNWYLGTIEEFHQEMTSEQQAIAKEIKKLCYEAVDNGVAKDLHTFHGKPLPEGYVYKFDELLQKIHELWKSMDLKFTD